MNIHDFRDFNQVNLIVERLHINKEIDRYSNLIYPLITNSEKSYFEFIDTPNNSNIHKLRINIKKLPNGVSGQLDIGKSHKTKLGWIIYINLKKNFNLHTLTHELNHALRLTLIGKDKMIRNLNHIKASNIFDTKDDEIKYFLYLIYLANDEEINAKVAETHGLIKDIINKLDTGELSKNYFNTIIYYSDALEIANKLINFKCEDTFKKYNNNQLNKLFYLLEENKLELDRIQDTWFSKIKIIIKIFKDLLSNKTGLSQIDDKIYKPRRGKKFYDRWIPSQGQKLKKRIYSLYDHYSLIFHRKT
jgi:hypothetical protein